MFSSNWLSKLAFSSLPLVVLPVVATSAWARGTPAAAADIPLSGSAADVPAEGGKSQEQERQEVETLLNKIEQDWNSHNLDAVMANYADDYINNDGLDKKAVLGLTQDFWKTYPDAKSTSKIKSIRIDDPYVTVSSSDEATGTTAKEMPGIGSKGELSSVSEGQLYLKKLGPSWKIVGDRIDFEKVRVAFGLAKQLNGSFSAPEQVKAGHQYTAKLDLSLPPGMAAVGSITHQVLQYPQPTPPDSWRPMESPTLERVMNANNNNHNELLMATVGITNSARNSLMGIAFLTRRLNVVPNAEEVAPETAAVKDTASNVPLESH
jgi:hypothetical protein